MDSHQEAIYALMAVVEDQRDELTQVLEEIRKERDELRKQNEALAAKLATVDESIEGVKLAASGGAAFGVDAALRETAKTALNSAKAAADPLVKKLAEATGAAEQAAANLIEAGDKVGSRQMLYAIICAALLMAVALTVGLGMQGWIGSDIVDLRQTRAQMQSTVDELERRGGGLQIASCDKTGKTTCVQINPKFQPVQDDKGNTWAMVKTR